MRFRHRLPNEITPKNNICFPIGTILAVQKQYENLGFHRIFSKYKKKEQNALLTIKDLVKLLKSSYSTIKRHIKALRERGFYIPIRGIIKDIGPSSHKVKILELYIKGYTPSEIEIATFHTIKSIERYILDFSRIAILSERGESIDNIRLIVGISESLVKKYQEMYMKYKDSEYKQKIDELVSNITIHDPPMTYKKNQVGKNIFPTDALFFEKRLHSKIGYILPIEFEETLTLNSVA